MDWGAEWADSMDYVIPVGIFFAVLIALVLLLGAWWDRFRRRVDADTVRALTPAVLRGEMAAWVAADEPGDALASARALVLRVLATPGVSALPRAEQAGRAVTASLQDDDGTPVTRRRLTRRLAAEAAALVKQGRRASPQVFVEADQVSQAHRDGLGSGARPLREDLQKSAR